ncbi:MAG: sialidase family protein, partial [bacterium]|nr:sialidase family protein [bacterium]
DDAGLTWTAPADPGLGPLAHATPYGRIHALPDGTLLMNVYGGVVESATGLAGVRRDYPHYAYLVRSPDQGEHWGEPALIAAAHNETALLHLPEGRLLAVSRSSMVQRLDVTFSQDGGWTWASPIRLSDWQQRPGDLVHLSNGWVVLVYADCSDEVRMIRAVVSTDQGRTWAFQRSNLVLSRPVQGDMGYPSAVCTPDGRIHILHYWAGNTLDEYDGTQARLYCTSFLETEFIAAFQSLEPSP